MTEEALFAKAYQAIGAYFSTFSALDRELGETIKVIFRLQQHEAADTIVAALGDIARKIGLVRAAVRIAKKVDGSETSSEWKERADDTMKSIYGCNTGDRVLLAHSYLEPNEDGSVKFTRLYLPDGVLKNRQETWVDSHFTTKIERLRDLTQRLQQIKDDLSTLTITVPDLGWMPIDPYQPQRREIPAADLSFSVTPVLPQNGVAKENND
jgi:hypothetical protein